MSIYIEIEKEKKIKMKYLLTVKIVNPKDEKVKELSFDVEFWYNKEQYGNGYGVAITRDAGEYFELSYDLRYDTNFDKDRKEDWIREWAKSYWTGEKGSYRLLSVDITRAI